MKLQKIIFIITFLLLSSVGSFAQATDKMTKDLTKPTASANKSSPAFAEVLLRRTELEATIEELVGEYTEEYPKLKETRFELGLVQKEINKLLAVNALESGKLTLALGKLIVRKAELETDLWALRQKYNDEHEEVKRAKRKLAVFDRAVKEILP